MFLSKYLSFLATNKFIKAVNLTSKKNKHAMNETNLNESHELRLIFLHCTDKYVIKVYGVYHRCECST